MAIADAIATAPTARLKRLTRGTLRQPVVISSKVARFGITVNEIAPSYLETDINRDFFETDAGDALIRRIPIRRLGHASELDGPILLLASGASRYMTGSVLVVDGGHMIGTL